MIYTTLMLKSGMFIPEVKFIEFNSYEDLERIINGKMEMIDVNIDGHFYDIILDEEHKTKGLPLTLALAHNSAITDLLAGDLIFLKADNEGRTLSLDHTDVERIKEHFTQSTIRYLDKDIKLPVYDWFRS